MRRERVNASVVLDAKLHKAIGKRAREEDRSRSSVVRQAITQLLDPPKSDELQKVG